MRKNTKRNGKGRLTVIAGPMFSGKTGKLVAMVEVFTRMGHKVLIVKPKLDNRYGGGDAIHSHDHRSSKAIVVDGETAQQIVDRVLASNVDKVILDEVQFFEKEKIKKVVTELKRRGFHVIAAGLLYDYKRQPFGATPDLLGLADERLEMYAVCQKCGSLAMHTERVGGTSGKQIEVGAADKYIAVCERCHKIYK